MKVPRLLETANSPDAHGVWFGGKVLQALEDNRPDLEHVDVEARFGERRLVAELKADLPQ